MRTHRPWWQPLLALLITVGLVGCEEQQRPHFTVGWSHYAGWEPLGYAAQAGILQRWARQEGIRIELVNLEASAGIAQMADGRLDGVTLTSVEALTTLAPAGVPTDAVVVTSWSNGNDGLVMRGGIGVADLQDRAVHLVEDSVSGYVLARAREVLGLPEGQLPPVMIQEAEILPLLRSDPMAVVVTWNPLLWEARKLQGARVVFDSQRLPEEILDLLVVRQDAPEALKRSLVGAWFETMAILHEAGPRRRAALEAMAQSSGASVTEFEAQLATTALMVSGRQTRVLLGDTVVREAFARQMRYAEQRGHLKPGEVGVELPGKRFVGNPQQVILRLDGAWLPADD